MKTREEVEALKKQWLLDPTWDIESTGGFEEYAAELSGFAVEHRKLWDEAREKEEAERYRNTPASEATLRDLFASAALQGELASQGSDTEWPANMSEQLSVRCFTFADAMMAARKVVKP